MNSAIDSWEKKHKNKKNLFFKCANIHYYIRKMPYVTAVELGKGITGNLVKDGN